MGDNGEKGCKKKGSKKFLLPLVVSKDGLQAYFFVKEAPTQMVKMGRFIGPQSDFPYGGLFRATQFGIFQD